MRDSQKKEMVFVRSNLNGILERPNQQIIEATKISNQESSGRVEHLERLLEEWVKSQDHLPENYDRNFARNFIRGAKCNLDSTKRKFEGYFLAKYTFPQYYSNRDPNSPKILKAMEHVTIVFLPKLTEQGDRLVIASLTDRDPADFDMESVVKLFLMIYDLILSSDSPYGSEIIIFNCVNFTPIHFVKFIGPAFKHILNITRDAYAIRLKEVHVCNSSKHIDRLVTAIRPFIHNKLRKRLIVHRTTDSLLESIPSKLLPADLGGTLEDTGSLMLKHKAMLLQNADYLRQQEDVKLKGKPGKRIDKFNSQQLEGSFRQLTID